MDELYITHCLIESITKTYYRKKIDFFFVFVLNEAGV